MSFATALLTGLGGYGRGRQQRFENTREQQDDTEKQAAAQRAAQTFQEQEEDRTRNRGTDPATGKAFVMPAPLTQVRPNNKGQGGPASLSDLYAHQTALARWYTQTGQTDQANIAGSQAAETARQLAAQQTQQAEWMRDVYNQGQQNNRDQFNQGQEGDRALQREQFDTWLHDNPTYRDLHPSNGSKASTPQAYAKAMATWYSDWKKDTLSVPGKLKYPSAPAGPGNPIVGGKASAVPPPLQLAAGKMFSRIDASPDPVGLAQKLAALVPNMAVKNALFARAAIAAGKNGTLATPQQNGGSDDEPGFPGE